MQRLHRRPTPDNVKFWLKRFPDWDLERKNKVVGGVALGQAVYMGPHRLELVKVLLEHGASINHLNDTGSSILTSLCNSEDADPELLELLLSKTKSETVNYMLRGRTLKWRNIYRLARLLTQNKFTQSGLMVALAQDSGSTALHYAIQRGDVDCVIMFRKWWMRGLKDKSKIVSDDENSALAKFKRRLRWKNDEKWFDSNGAGLLFCMNAFELCEKAGPFPSVQRVLREHQQQEHKK